VTVLPLRTRTIGGSDAAAAAGIDPHKSRVMLYLEKTGQVERPETEAMRWGRLLQNLVLEELIERGYVAWEIRPEAGQGPWPLADPERSWLTGQPDGMVLLDKGTLPTLDGDEALLEVKTVGQWAKREWNGSPPLAYVAQVQHYLHLTGLGRALLAVLVGGQRLELVTIGRDDRAIARLLELEEEFYGHLIRGELPAPDGSPSARDALAALYPEATGGRKVRLDKAGWATLRELHARREQRDAIDTQIRELENRLKATMGDAEVAISPHDDEVIRWRNVEQHRVDVKALREAYPDIAAEFVKVTSTRRFQAL
jgi:putative phage-type endonuclease